MSNVEVEGRNWKIAFIIEEIGVTKNLYLNNLITLSSAIVELTSKLDSNIRWTEFEVWDPIKNQWILNRRQPLIAHGLYNDYILHFKRASKPVYIILPNFEVIHIKVNFSQPCYYAVILLCNTLNIRCGEEMSFRKVPFKNKTFLKSPEIVQSMLSDDTMEFNLLRDKILSKQHYEMPEFLKEAYPPRNNPNLWCDLQNSWLKPKQSLKEQGIEEDEILQIRFRFFNFFDLTTGKDNLRLNLLFMQTYWSLKGQELICSDQEQINLGALFWHIHSLRFKYITNDSSREKNKVDHDIDDIDYALENLESNLERDFTEPLTLPTVVANISETFEIIRASNSKVKGKQWKVSLNGQSLSVYNIKAGSNPTYTCSIIGATVLFTARVDRDQYIINITQNNYQNETPSKIKSISILITSPTIFIEWLMTLRFTSRNANLAGTSFTMACYYGNSFIKLIKKSRNTTSTEEDLILEHIYNPIIIKNMGKQALAEKMLDEIPTFYLLNYDDSIQSFIRIFRGIKFHDLALFKALIIKDDIVPKRIEFLGVNSLGIVIINPKSYEIVKEWPFSTLKQWSINWSTLRQNLIFENEKFGVQFMEANIATLHEYIGTYIFLKMRKNTIEEIDFDKYKKLVLNVP